MFLLFPDLDTLRLAITSGVAPVAISLAPAAAASDDQGRLWLEPSEALPRGVQTGLRKLGVELLKDQPGLLLENVCCWPQLLPLRRDAEPPALSGQAPVLFDLPDAGQLPELVSEILRLGNDRQSFRYLESETSTRVLLRVVGPPYYSLLRALERDGVVSGPRAYVEKGPRVWVEIGHSHPLIEQIQAPKGQVLLMQPPRAWTFLDDAPFRDIYDILELNLPEAAIRWPEGKLSERLTVPLRLARGGGAEQAELWVLRRKPMEQLDALVREADDRLLKRLSFAVVQPQRGEPATIVLRARPSKQAVPVLVLDAKSFRPYLKLQNLYLPCGSRLGPPLRRDAVRKLLADDPALVTWLYPNGDGRFTPESLPELAFQPLEHWIDYILDHDRQPLEAWVQSAQFDFEAFICSDDQPAPEKKKEKPKGEKDKDKPRGRTDTADAVEEGKHHEEPKTRRKPARDDFAALPKATPSELEKKRQELEKRFLDLKVPLDAVERQELWRELALLNTALGKDKAIDATICWAHSFWEEEDPEPHWLKAWFEAEARTRRGAEPQAVDAEIARILELKEDPPEADLRTLAAGLAWAAALSAAGSPLPRVAALLDRIQRFLEKHEGMLSVRLFWLAWVSLVQLSRGDILALARARDRLLERLYLEGLNAERDLPSFLRFSGHRSADRFRAIRERLVHLHELAKLWCETEKIIDDHDNLRDHHTEAYVDLMFAFGLARIGEVGASDRLLTEATAMLGNLDEVHSFLLQAFTYRVGQAKEGKPHAGPLPPALLEQIETLHTRERKKKADDREQSKHSIYKVEKLREISSILEPHDKVDATRRTLLPKEELTNLSTITDREDLIKRIKGMLLRETARENRIPVVAAGLRLGARLGDEFATELLQQAITLLHELSREGAHEKARPDSLNLDPRFLILERAIFVAAHYDHRELAKEFTQYFVTFFEALHKSPWTNRLNMLVHQCFRGLRKFGFRDEIDRLLQQMARVIQQDQDLPSVRERDGRNWPSTLSTLLHIAAGWFYFGRNDRAIPILDIARDELFQADIPTQDKNKLALAYCKCLGEAPVELALQRFEELFQNVGHIADAYFTKSHYYVSRLEIVEATVLAVVSDDFTLGSEVRRWLEDDEFLVRRRIHRDLKTSMTQAGM